MLVEDGLLSAVERWELSRHPFWNDWRPGLVTRPQVALLARELGRVIPLLASAWDMVNDFETAEQAGELALRWHPFAAGLEEFAPAQSPDSADRLVSLTRSAFLKEHTSLGALAAVHSQLPLIGRQLIELLDVAYPADGARVKPFAEYVNAHPELARLPQQYLNQYSSAQQAAGLEAAEAEGEALWELFLELQTPAA